MQHHIEQINELAQLPGGAASIARFAVLTIRTQFQTMPFQVADYINTGSRSRFVWGHKRQADAYLTANVVTLQETAARAQSDAELVEAFIAVPGLGLAKAGFCAQMFANRVGCLDYLNEKLYNVTVPKLSKKVAPATRRKHVENYINTCASIADSATLWARWCDEVGKRKNWPDGEAVSQTHVNLISALIRNV